ncbi:aminoglycoside phosphotransferase family protein [Nonomuraea sp. NPDC052129]|uniref:aminoglycoside phosphotransferase family protein n=1 Tax=Nonomuraea sp. NPDC052129 TaxID=3154651 RepID=UPI0034309FCB
MSDRSIEEQPLMGGVDNVGAVVKVGDTVRRPGGPNALQVRELLGHLERVGFRGAPRFLGVDERGREILEYLEGDVAIPPYPNWAADDDLLVSVARLQRQLHAAAAGFRFSGGGTWPPDQHLPGVEGDLVCHTDLCLENVVVRGGRAVAFVDFDGARPVDPLFDIAIATRHWIPLRDPVDIEDARMDADLVRRFHLFTGEHQLTGDQRDRLVGMLIDFMDWALVSLRARAESGHVGFAGLSAQGYEGMNRRSRTWLIENRYKLAGGEPG